MQHATLVPVVKNALRREICPVCIQRPAGSEALGPTVPRSCEEGCPIFKYAAKMVGIACIARGQEQPALEHMVLDHVCDHCEQSQSAGDFCVDRMNRTCPLSVHLLKVVETIEPVINLHLPPLPPTKTKPAAPAVRPGK
jgi:hypothetical protein